jgi:hypothetical protein
VLVQLKVMGAHCWIELVMANVEMPAWTTEGRRESRRRGRSIGDRAGGWRAELDLREEEIMAGVDALGESVTKSKEPDRQDENLGNESSRARVLGWSFETWLVFRC